MADQRPDATREFDERLFDYVNGMLAADRRAEFETYLAEHADAAQEVRRWQALRTELEAAAESRAPDDGLPQFMRQIRAMSRGRGSILRGWLERMAQRRFAPPVFAAAMLLLVLQSGVLVSLLVPSPAPDGAIVDGGAMTRSIGRGVHAGDVMRIRFRATATAKDITLLLSEAGASIASGPGQGGFYDVVVAEAALSAAQQKFKSSGLVDEVIVDAPARAAPAPRR